VRAAATLWPVWLYPCTLDPIKAQYLVLRARYSSESILCYPPTPTPQKTITATKGKWAKVSSGEQQGVSKRQGSSAASGHNVSASRNVGHMLQLIVGVFVDLLFWVCDLQVQGSPMSHAGS
jgi:hypothetical protein